MTLTELSAKIASVIAEKAKTQLDAKQDKLTITGAANKGVYISASGVVSAMTYALNKDVPSNAVFTDTTYSTATTSANGLMSAADKSKLDGIPADATNNAGTITGITMNGVSKGASGVVDLGTVLTEHQDISGKVDKVSGKGLSTEDYTTAEKNKLAGIASGATANAAATAAPLMDGAAAVGTSTAYARGDHVHPTDTSRAAAADVAALQSENAIFREYFANMEVYRTASGDPATFSDAYAANVRNLAVTITPTQSGSGDPSPSNVRPISGVSSVTVTRTGKNMLPILSSSSVDGYSHILNADGSVTFSGSGSTMGEQTGIHFIANRIPLPPGNYKISVTFGSGASNFAINGFLPANAASGREHSTYFSLNAAAPSAKSAAFTVWKNDVVNVYSYIPNRAADASGTAFVMITRADETDESFEAYQSQTVSVSLVDANSDPLTVYGGTLDVTAGTLTVTHIKRTLTSSMTIGQYNTLGAGISFDNFLEINRFRSPGLCSHAVVETSYPSGSGRSAYMWLGVNSKILYWINILGALGLSSVNDFKTWLDTQTVEIAYELDTPVTYTLTPAQLAALSGYNGVYADSGNVTVEYRADVGLSIDEIANAILSLGAGI